MKIIAFEEKPEGRTKLETNAQGSAIFLEIYIV
jgi:hypothetical protein